MSAALRIVAREDPSWGYRLAGGYLRLRGWQLNDKRVFRLWRLNGLSLPPYRPRRKIRSLTVKDEATGYCLAIKTGRHLQHQHVKAALREMITRFGTPKAIRSDNGSELLAGALQEQMKSYGIQLANIEPGKPWRWECKYHVVEWQQ